MSRRTDRTTLFPKIIEMRGNRIGWTEISERLHCSSALISECLKQHGMFTRNHIVDGMKICYRCGINKPVSQYYTVTKGSTDIGSCCKECDNERGREYRQKHPEVYQNYYHRNRPRIQAKERRERYGLDSDQFNELLRSQNGKCAICFSSESGGRNNTWHVDHDHATGIVRGLLCAGCNVGLGNFKDIPERMRLAAAYLEKHFGFDDSSLMGSC